MKYLKRISKLIGMAIVLSSLFLLIRAGLVSVNAAQDNVSKAFLPKNIVEQRVDSVMKTLSLREKIAQLIIIEFCSEDKPEVMELQNYLVSKENVGGLILMYDVMEPGLKRTNELHRLAKTPLLMTIDAEWGMSMRYREVPVFPRQMQLGALAHDSLVYKAGYMIGKECREYNYHVNYASDIDVNINGENPVINTRAFGENKHKVAVYGAAFMRGMNDAGVFGSAKHFPGHGDTNVDSHKALPTLDFSYERLDTLEMYPFKHLIAENADMVMVAHLNVPALDPTGTPASISKPVVTGLLKEKLGYKGIVITDALNMKGVCDHLEKKMIALEAYKAGVDILLMPEEVIDSITEIEKAIERGEITRSSLDEKVRKVLTLKAKAGLFEKNYNPCIEYDLIKDTIAKVENKAFISYLAKESVTLVTNHKLSDGTQELPIKSLREKKIAYLGYDAENFGKESAELIRRYADVDTLILRGPVKDRDLKKAIRKLKGYDLVILGFNNTDSRPQFNFGVNPKHMDMMTGWAKEQDIIFMFMGNPYVLNKIEDYNNFKAFIVGYGNSVFNNQAAVQIVFGGIPSKGVLPVSAGEFKEGESVIIKRAVRPEIKLYSKDSTYRMEHGAIIGNHIVTPAGDTIWYNTPIDINPAFFEEMFSEICDSQLNVADNYDEVKGVLRALGMGDTKLSKDGNKLHLTSTLDDMSKFFTMIMRNGEYGGETILKEPIMKRNGAFPVAKNGLKVSLDADTMSLVYNF
jgi:beta-glucosidase-like glycosyl hydrolase